MGRLVVSFSTVMVNAQEKMAHIICIDELIQEGDVSVVVTDLKIPFPLVKVDYLYGCVFKFLWDTLLPPHTVKQLCQFLCHRPWQELHLHLEQYQMTVVELLFLFPRRLEFHLTERCTLSVEVYQLHPR